MLPLSFQILSCDHLLPLKSKSFSSPESKPNPPPLPPQKLKSPYSHHQCRQGSWKQSKNPNATSEAGPFVDIRGLFGVAT